MNSLTFYGGVNEVGGNKILLETSKAKIFLDFGMNFSALNKYYAEFMQPRKVNKLGDQIEMGLVPSIKGLYRNDFVSRSDLKESKPLFDAVLLSHPHFDHFGHFDLLHPDIPIYMGETTKLIIKAIEDTGNSCQYLTYKDAFTGLSPKKNPKKDRIVNIYRTGDSFKIKDVEIIPFHVDHSIPGAYGYIIKTPSGNIVYTGDLRMHGAKASMTKDFVKKAASFNPIALIIEGTRVGDNLEKREDRKMGLTEKQVFGKIKDYISSTKGLVVANFPARDIDRFNTFYKAAVANNRKLVIDLKQAYLLKLLEQDKHLKVPKVNDKNILVYVKRTNKGFITEDVSFDVKEKDYRIWAREFLDLPNSVTFKDLDQKKSVFYCNAFSFSELIDIKPIPNSSYIYSLCEPFNIEMELDMERVKNWIQHFKLKYFTAHASGHASAEEIKEIINIINAKKVFPVHTEHEEMFKEFSDKVKLVKVGEKVKV